MAGDHRWGLGTKSVGNGIRFFAFSALHLGTYAANLGVLVYLCRFLWTTHLSEHAYLGKLAYCLLLATAHLLVGLYCVHLAMGDRGIKKFCMYVFGYSGKPLRYLICGFLGLTQLIQLKVAFDKYSRREEMPMEVDSGDVFSDEEDVEEQPERTPEARRAAIVEHRIPWAFPSKCFEGIFEGCIFAFVLLYAILKIGWEDDQFVDEWADSWEGYTMVLLSGIGSFCTVGMSMLNFDYHLSPAVQKTVDHSMWYTLIHFCFRSCEAGVRVSMVVFAALAFRSCHQTWKMLLPYFVLVLDYFFGVAVLVWLSAEEEKQFASLKTFRGTLKRICIAMLTGFLLLLANLAEFVDEADRRELRRSARTFSRAYRGIRFVELLALFVLCFLTPCSIGANHVTLFDYLCGVHKLVFIAFVVAVVLYYSMVILSFHSFAIAGMDGIETVHIGERMLRAVVDLPESNDILEANNLSASRISLSNEGRDAPLLEDGRQEPSAPRSPRPELSDPRSPRPELVGSGRVYSARDSDMPVSMREETGTFYATSDNEYCIVRAPSLSFLLMSKGLHGSVANMVLARIDEDDALPSDNIVRRDRLQMSDFELRDRLGSGSYANVFKCIKKSTGEIFAMKRLVKNNYVRRKGAEAEFPRRERDALFLAGRHPNVAFLECAFETDSYWVLVTELCELGSLTKFIKRSGGGLDVEEANVVGTQILKGLDHLHKQCILHRDIKPDNVGMGGTMQEPIPKLIDFGFAKRAEATQSNTIVGSHGYVAPEIEHARRVFGPLRQAADVHDGRIDIYSCGVLLFVIFTGREAVADGPYKSLWSHQQFRGMLMSAEHPMWKCSLYTHKGIDGTVIQKRMKESFALDAIIAMTETDPNNRPRTTSDAMKLRFFVDDGQFAAMVSEETKPGSLESES